MEISRNISVPPERVPECRTCDRFRRGNNLERKMCDHCAKVTSQKGYAGQVTCKCEHPGKKEAEASSREKDTGGCCGKKAREAAGGCCMSGCCKDARNGKGKEKEKGAEAGSEAAGGCCAGNRK